MRFDPAHEIWVVARRLDNRLHIDAGRSVEIDIAVTEKTSGKVSRDEGVDPGLGGLDNEFAEAVESQRAGPALVDDRRHSGAHSDEVGVQTEIARYILVDGRVGVDKTGGDDEACGIDDLCWAGIELRGDDG